MDIRCKRIEIKLTRKKLADWINAREKKNLDINLLQEADQLLVQFDSMLYNMLKGEKQ